MKNRIKKLEVTGEALADIFRNGNGNEIHCYKIIENQLPQDAKIVDVYSYHSGIAVLLVESKEYEEVEMNAPFDKIPTLEAPVAIGITLCDNCKIRLEKAEKEKKIFEDKVKEQKENDK